MKKKTRELIGWIFILVALGLQPIHWWAMTEQTTQSHGVIEWDKIQFHLTQWSFWGDIGWLMIDLLEIPAMFETWHKFRVWRKDAKRHD